MLRSWLSGRAQKHEHREKSGKIAKHGQGMSILQILPDTIPN